jgi:hypothetical protein
MAPILTPEDVVGRIAAECTFVDERGAVGIRLRPAAAIVRQYGSQFRSPRRKRRPRPPNRRRYCDRLMPPGSVLQGLKETRQKC